MKVKETYFDEILGENAIEEVCECEVVEKCRRNGVDEIYIAIQRC